MGAPRYKGVSIAALVAALRDHPDRERLLPKELHKYFTEKIIVSAWYPQDVYFPLLKAVAATRDGKGFGGDPYAQMGAIAARRDVGGATNHHSPHQLEHAGIYKRFARSDDGVENFFRRANRVYHLYNDTGHYEIAGGIPERNAVVRRLVGIHIPLHGFLRLQRGYVEEYSKLSGLPMQVTILHSTAKGDRFCEWECQLPRTPETEAYVASLARYDPQSAL